MYFYLNLIFAVYRVKKKNLKGLKKRVSEAWRNTTPTIPTNLRKKRACVLELGHYFVLLKLQLNNGLSAP